MWITIIGANYPSQWLSDLFVGWLYPLLKDGANALHFPWWLSSFLIDGVYLATTWVISVMLPPMAIFFPLFTLLEDFGYLPRVAFNLDKLFRTAGAHGKQALTMSMGFGCNAAGVVATRIINSPREKLIAIITNNFSLCNGRLAYPNTHCYLVHWGISSQAVEWYSCDARRDRYRSVGYSIFIPHFVVVEQDPTQRRIVIFCIGITALSSAAFFPNTLHLTY